MSDLPRSALRILLPACVAVAAVTVAIPGIDSHMDRGLVPGSCSACHLGHGVSRSPMLAAAQSEVCLACHGTQADRDRMVSRGLLASSARPPLLGSTLSLPFVHRLDAAAMTREEPNVVTCTSCHSPHRSPESSTAQARDAPGKRISPRNPNRFEYELCHECHGEIAVAVPGREDIRRLANPSSRSFHPIESPAAERSPSVDDSLAGAEISCSDCHGNREPGRSRGPHGSSVAHLLGDEYTVGGGNAESARTYALCYRCHEREQVLDSAAFPEHRRHVVEIRASCSTCHNPHGSVDSRALVRFGEKLPPPGVAPSLMQDRLLFVSTSPGEGACYLTCHGHDHAPATYGGTASEPHPIEVAPRPFGRR